MMFVRTLLALSLASVVLSQSGPTSTSDLPVIGDSIAAAPPTDPPSTAVGKLPALGCV